MYIFEHLTKDCLAYVFGWCLGAEPGQAITPAEQESVKCFFVLKHLAHILSKKNLELRITGL